MTARLAEIWRHPIKSHGRERLDRVALAPGRTLPGDRRWAVAHEAARTDGSAWAPCANFSRGSKAPGLMAINARYDEATGTVTLSHPDRSDLTFDPDADPAAFLDWVRPLMPADRAASARIVRVEGRGMTDTDYPSVSLIGLGSHRAVEGRLGRALSPLRWRCNFWLDGTAPWEEFEWIGREVQLGEVVLAVREPIRRCLATTANPETGLRDADTLGTLAQWNHQNFGIYAEVLRGGTVRPGDRASVL